MQSINAILMKRTFFLAMLLCLLAGCNKWEQFNQETVNNDPVESIDWARYSGVWYEIARIDHYFERGMTHTQAVYTLREDGKVEVQNSGIKKGKKKTSKGRAKPTEEPALLRVSFFGPFYNDYRVLMVDADYQFALVGGSTDDYLWILSRTPQIDEEIKARILAEAQRRDYETYRLLWVIQN